jgi:phage terminase large subunit-like protein
MLEIDDLLKSLTPAEANAALFSWELWARPDQLAPPGDWRVWLQLGGRGSGKTRSGNEWLRGHLESGRHVHAAIVSQSMESARKIIVEGPSGLLNICPGWAMPTFEPSNRLLRWPNGAVCHLLSDAEPDLIRGYNLSIAFVDELAAFQNLERTWAMLNMAVRISGPHGHPPQIAIATTPRPLKLLKALIADPSVAVTRSRTVDNARHLDRAALDFLVQRYGGTTLGLQELDARILEDSENALFTRSLIEKNRVDPRHQPRQYRRVVVSVDPAVSWGPDSDETGIVVAGTDDRGDGYLLQDLSGKFSPDRWARIVVDAYRRHLADRVVAEINQGGELVERIIRGIDRSIAYRGVHSRRGKMLRAEPIVALYEQGRIHHVGMFEQLEDQCCSYDPDDSRGRSPDRLDALTQAFHELMVRKQGSLVERRRTSPAVIPIFAR